MQTSFKSPSASIVSRSAVTLISLAAFSFAFMLAATPASAESHITWSWGSGKMIRGSGNVVEQTLAASAFDKVAAQDGIRVVLRRGAMQKVSVKADDNILPLVEAKVDGSRLLLRMQPKTSAQTKSGIVVTIDYTALNALTVSDGARGELDLASGSAFRAIAKDGSTLNITEATAADFDLRFLSRRKIQVAYIIGNEQHLLYYRCYVQQTHCLELLLVNFEKGREKI